MERNLSKGMAWLMKAYISYDHIRVVAVSPTDSVLTTTKKMLEHKLSSAVVTVDNKPQGILT